MSKRLWWVVLLGMGCAGSSPTPDAESRAPGIADGGPAEPDAPVVDAALNGLDAAALDAAGSEASAPDPRDSGQDSDTGISVEVHAALPPARAVQRDVFATALVCSECHSASDFSSANRDEQNRPVGLYELWSASAMGNAARDPLFRAALANEIARAPAAGATISSVCLSCHAPMARVTQKRVDGGPTTLGDVYAASDQGELARDGVSCTLCHQVQASNLGQEASYSAGYLVGATREIFGPYAAPFAMPMRARVGFTPVQGLHVQESSLCGSCHTLVTESFTAGGVATGHRMGEQLTYLEWRHSAFSTEGGGSTPASCQSCHMPDVQGDGMPLATRLAHRPDGADFPPIGARGPFSRHSFVGANTLLPRLLKQGRALLNPAASDLALEAAEQRARDLLRQRTATLTVVDPQRAERSLSFRVHVENRVGHKLPSGYPSRRLFLQVRVLDAKGRSLFELGAVDRAGRLVAADGTPLPAELHGGPAHPHRTRITSDEQAIVWESVMSDGHGAPSYELLAAEGFIKDNRLLPRGHADATTGPLSTAPVGVDDTDFVAGSDDVAFTLSSLSEAPARIEVRLLYQTLSPRYQDELLTRDTAEAVALRGMLDETGLAPELIAEATVSVP